MKVKPLSDLILVREITEEKSAGGVFLPQTASSKDSKISEVIATGPGKLDAYGNVSEMTLKVGDKVWHKKFDGADLMIDDDKFTIINESDILAVAS